ncbi:MAG TPA: CvpA family protein [Candidatus Avimonas sp.]|nr:CvpA family protein [Clostridiales bacterium]HPU58493.1 CvpA family protein [Candidatus Avimonas sp.]
MAYILDGLVIIIFLLAIFLGYRRGFFKSVIQVIGCIVAAVIASGLSTPIAAGLYDQIFSGSIQKQIEEKITQAGSESVEAALGGVLEDLPDSVTNVLSIFDLGTASQLKNRIQGSLSGTASQISKAIESTVIRPAAISLLRILIFFILFIVLMIVAGVVASVVGKVFKLPVLRQADGLLGAIFGAVRGVVLVFAVVTVISLIASTSKSDGKITRATVKDTVVVEAIEKINPITDKFYSMFDAKSV